MSQTFSLPSYALLTKAIQSFQPNGDAAQTHGLLCGYLCATTGDIGDWWENIFPGIKKSKKLYSLLQEVIEESYHHLSEFSFEFSLILPNEKSELSVRAETLGLWCQGFLTGLEWGNVLLQDRAPGQVKEALDDMLEISEISFDGIAGNDEDESAYFELVEYVRLSVLMIFHEIKTENAPDTKNDDENPSLH